MDADQESLLSPTKSSTTRISPGLSRGSIGTGSSRWKKSIYFLVAIIGITVCLTIYLYLNIKAINGNQSDSNRFKPLSRRKPMLDHESIYTDSGPSMIKLSDLLAHCIVALRVAGRDVVNLSLAHNNRLHQVGSKGKTLEGADDIVTGVDLKSHSIIVNTIKDSYKRLNVVSEEDSTKAFEGTSLKDNTLPLNRTEFAQMLRDDLHLIESNEGGTNLLISQSETLVWIDPLDATKEYSENLTNYVTLMACIVYKSVPIAGVIFKPFTNETYWSYSDVGNQKHHFSEKIYQALDEAKSEEPTDNIRIIVSRSHAGNIKAVLEKSYGQKVKIKSAGGSGYKTIELLRGKADAYIHLTHIKKWDICAPYAIVNSLKNGRLSNLKGQQLEFGDPKDKIITSGVIATLNEKVHSELLKLNENSSNKNVI